MCAIVCYIRSPCNPSIPLKREISKATVYLESKKCICGCSLNLFGFPSQVFIICCVYFFYFSASSVAEWKIRINFCI